ncbi:MAG: primosomal protein N' [Actinobacteria bacterium]|nr:MAG: primosomal protein N' [Actinomycetota bacterium]
MRYGTVVPLVTARALSSREFTYELPDGAGKGAVVSVPFGRSRARGVVVEVVDAPPAGVKPLPVERVVHELPAPLIDLALWVAEYYGSTPARALELVAPVRRARRKEQGPPAERQSLEGEAEPESLSEAQELALARVTAALDEGGGHFLLYGPTGSGKTEVYLQAAAAALERGLGTIVLVPEIALAPQTVGRFRARFGDSVAILHSGLSEAERRDERHRIAGGEARVVVGARSAIFAPMERVGLICIDEEHDASYKQESDPRYDARTVAAKRAALEGAVALYGSATPRPESWAALERIELPQRLGGKLPPVKIVDLRREAGYPLSAPLLAELGAIAENGGKAILLLNRRGIAPALHCRACGATFRCPDCDVALVLHRDGSLRCHHCGHAEPAPEECPVCRSVELARIGAGTQRLERELAARVPELELIRLDADTAGNPEELAAALRRFRDTDRAVLLGTQMVAKGHHFAGVALAAVVDADAGLGLPDLRAEERTFQLVTQLAGRSGRDAPGRVLVQTFQPDARPLELAARHDVPRFLADELERRRELGYPPFRHLVRVLVTGPAEAPALQLLEELRAGLEGTGDLLGPAPLFRLRGRHRAQLVAKTDEPRRLAARAAQLLAAAAPAMRRAGLTAVVDVDPQSV